MMIALRKHEQARIAQRWSGEGFELVADDPAVKAPGPAERVQQAGQQDRLHLEQIIANFKTLRAMHTDYRRPIAKFATTISIFIASHFYKLGQITPSAVVS